ncbi:hypothetical protein [Kribbella catacumbae]|nr:hypothetical protein [Kribbella catacumbae]
MAIGLWVLALMLAIAGLASAFRYKLILSALLLCSGMAIGLYAGNLLP